ncbi:MAG: peptide chain release factor-like protein [Candidatus Omnitrophica bacterium]|jgi:protein subunit release factor B|nr:peptide chain release factor-like protein [Candidatus Omnitrophota bacterium]MDD5081704.1 peptide chain release factor-like protein [Candidatus Omnitrophota bacterium]MDD5441160.1 peptide chain release factor-like protein [Candidatus Omnitrophota bacterium]
MKQLNFPVTIQKQEALYRKMTDLNILESDIKEQFIRSQGHGGQNVNKTATCVYLKHIPTNTEIKCQKTRSQPLNRFFARRLLIEKIESGIFNVKSEKQKKIEKIKRQKRKRSKRSKEKMLELKKQHSEKKQNRSEDYKIN